MRYSILITHRNNRATVQASLDSVLDQIDEDFEVIVVDSKSNDGSGEILKGYEGEGKIRLIERKCSRGKGRQIALESCHGEIVISNLDMDETYSPGLKALIRIYENSALGKVLHVVSGLSKDERGRQNITIATKDFLKEVGGWRDINYGEDWDLWRRAAERGRYSLAVFPLVTGEDPSLGKVSKTLPRLRLRYTRYVSMIRLGHHVFDDRDKATFSQRGVYLLARLVALFRTRYEKAVTFDSYDPKSLIESAAADTSQSR